MNAVALGASAAEVAHLDVAGRIHVVHSAQFDEDSDDDCPDVDVPDFSDVQDVPNVPDVDAHFGPNFPFDDDTPKPDPFDHDFN